MKLCFILIEWEYPEDEKTPEPEFLDLSSAGKNDLMILYLAFANGIIVEMRADGDSEEAIQLIRGLALGAGSCTLIESLPDETKARLWLYKDGYECYRQGSGPQAGYIFVNPKPQPDI